MQRECMTLKLASRPDSSFPSLFVIGDRQSSWSSTLARTQQRATLSLDPIRAELTRWWASLRFLTGSGNFLCPKPRANGRNSMKVVVLWSFQLTRLSNSSIWKAMCSSICQRSLSEGRSSRGRRVLRVWPSLSHVFRPNWFCHCCMVGLLLTSSF